MDELKRRRSSRKTSSNNARGNMLDFFDPNITAQLQRPRTASASIGKTHNDFRHRITASLSNGQLHIDNRKVLKDECVSEFRDRWFFKAQDQVHPVRLEK